jgi:hypothetical protein
MALCFFSIHSMFDRTFYEFIKIAFEADLKTAFRDINFHNTFDRTYYENKASTPHSLYELGRS